MTKEFVKKVIKIAGNMLMLAAVLFLVKRIIDMDVDFAQFGKPQVIVALVLGFAVLSLNVVISTCPWLVFVQSLSGKKIPFSKAMPVFARSNLYKYVPGNVFQYIGRNQLAADMEISHVDVACATILDILFCVIAPGVLSLLLLGSAIAELLQKYGSRFLLIGSIGIAAVLALAALIFWKFREECKRYLSRYARAFEKKNLPFLLRGILCYFLQNAVLAAMYFGALALIFGGTAAADQLLTLTGSFLFAWIVGFITPGAPGGLGIRESVMLFMCRAAAWEEQILLFVLVMRIASIFADAAAFAIGTACQKLQKGR